MVPIRCISRGEATIVKSISLNFLAMKSLFFKFSTRMPISILVSTLLSILSFKYISIFNLSFLFKISFIPSYT